VLLTTTISLATVRSNERFQYHNEISYIQAWRTIQALLVEIDGDEADCFAKFPAYIKLYKAADRFNYAYLKLSEKGNFETAFFALAGCAKSM
jgi:hypothetical protein